MLAENKTVAEIRREVENKCGIKMPPVLVQNLISKYGEQKIKEKIPLLGRVETENAPGFLIAALKDDYQLLPGRPLQQPERKKNSIRATEKNKIRGWCCREN